MDSKGKCADTCLFMYVFDNFFMSKGRGFSKMHNCLGISIDSLTSMHSAFLKCNNDFAFIVSV